MCGLIGIIDHSTQGLWGSDADRFMYMLLLNSTRGWDSTGVVGVRKDKEVDIVKVAGHPYNLFQSKPWDEWKKRVAFQYHSIIGHGRLATRGKVNAKNAHPFERGAVTLVHNGTLTNFEELKKKYTNPEVFEVDSDLCADMFFQFGHMDTLEQIEGAFAFIWNDSRDNKIRAVRNQERPLFIMHREAAAYRQYYLSSDPAVFDFIKSKFLEVKGKVEIVPSGTMLEFDTVKQDLQLVPVKFHATKFYSRADYDDNDYWDAWSRMGVKDEKKEEKKEQKEHKTFRQGTLKVKVGDRINFAPFDYTEHVDQNTGEQWCILKGTAVVDIPIEVRARVNDIHDLLDEPVCSGIIRSIIPYGKDDQFVCRVFVSDVKAVNTKSVDNVEEFLDLVDETRIPKHRFLKLAESPCTCGKGILPIQSANCIIAQEKLYCPECTMTGKYPKDA